MIVDSIVHLERMRAYGRIPLMTLELLILVLILAMLVVFIVVILRIALRYDAWPHCEEMSKEERRAIAFERLNSESPEELFDIRWIEVPLPEKARVFKTVRCAKCGEGAMEPRAHLSDGQPVCAECYGQPYTRGW